MGNLAQVSETALFYQACMGAYTPSPNPGAAYPSMAECYKANNLLCAVVRRLVIVAYNDEFYLVVLRQYWPQSDASHVSGIIQIKEHLFIAAFI